MTPRRKGLLGGLALVAATVGALLVASGFGAAPAAEPPGHHVNRSLKGDRLHVPAVSAVPKNPVRTIREWPREPEQASKPKLMDGCEPLFSPVTVPSAAHLAGRCIG